MKERMLQNRTFHRLKKEVGIAVLIKYNNTCTVCGSTKNLCVHHKILTLVSDPSYNNEDNLTVLCKKCHMSHHRRNGDVLTAGGNSYGRRGKCPPIKCIEPACDNFQHGRSLCKKHYEKRRRHGTLGI